MAEQAFLDEFGKLVCHLTERIGGVGDDGKPKVFRDSAIGNLGDFFERFRNLNVRSNEQLDELVAQAQRAVRGIGAQDLRDSGDLRQRVATELNSGPVGPGRADGRSSPSAHHPADQAQRGVIVNLIIEADGRSGASTARRSPWMPSGCPGSAGPAMSNRTTRGAGWPTCRPSGGRSSAPSTGVRRPWERRWRGWRQNWLDASVGRPGPELPCSGPGGFRVARPELDRRRIRTEEPREARATTSTVAAMAKNGARRNPATMPSTAPGQPKCLPPRIRPSVASESTAKVEKTLIASDPDQPADQEMRRTPP